MNSQPSSSCDAHDRLRRRRSAGADDPDLVAAGDLAVPVGGGVEHRGDDGRRRAHDGDAVLLDPAQDLGAVDLAQHDLRDAEAGHRERHAPAVGVEHRQRVEVDVAVGDGRVHRERHRVDPDVAVGDLHALGTRGRAGRVVDAGRRRLVGLPRARLDALRGVQVVVVAEHEAVLRGDAGQCLVELGVDVQHASAGVLDDVGDLVGAQPEVHRHQHATGARDAEERRQQAGAVVGDHRDPVADLEAELVELGRLAPGQRRDLRVGQVAQRRGGLVGFVDHPDPLAVDDARSVEEVGHGEGHEHALTVARSTLPCREPDRWTVRIGRRTARPMRELSSVVSRASPCSAATGCRP